LRLTECERYDLILMDLQMPEVDGFAAARAVRAQDSANRDTPIIALSADVLPEHVAASARAGMNGHIGKPISPVELLGAIARWAAVRVTEDEKAACG
jgi:CheY-like chemotaxis protein